jgi:RNA polymerase sigma factor (TIGR02999 family)
MSDQPPDVTQLLIDWTAGHEDALERLMPLVYDDLKRRARAHLSRERPGHTLQATALVNEAYMRLVDQQRVQWQNRAQFVAIASRMMRRILVDHARTTKRSKRGGGAPKVALDDVDIAAGTPDLDFEALDQALTMLAALDQRQAQVVELRFFGGLTNEETGQALGISVATVKREWDMARAWLRNRLSSEEPS